MAKRIEAITAYRPRIQLEYTVGPNRFLRQLRAVRNIHQGTAVQVLMGLQDVLMFLLLTGTPARVPFLGTFTPTIKADGTIKVTVRLERTYEQKLNPYTIFQGRIENRRLIGQSTEEWVQRWNKEHPEDPIEE